MGWKRDHYRKKRSTRLRPREIPDCDGQELIYNNFIFRDHFFDNYRLRVSEDHQGLTRTNLEIARIATHCFAEADIPKKLGLQSRVLVDFHIHNGGDSRSFGIFYVPMRRDYLDLKSGRICAITLLNAQEKYESLHEKYGSGLFSNHFS